MQAAWSRDGLDANLRFLRERMMTYQRFEDIPVWQAAIGLAERVFGLTGDRAFAGQGDIANQIQRAVLSVSNNVAEGFERGSTNELITFQYYARIGGRSAVDFVSAGADGEVRGQRHLNDGMRAEFDQTRRAEAFRQKLQRVRENGKSQPPTSSSESE
jgi:hypothetical protein